MVREWNAQDGIRIRVDGVTGRHDRPLHYLGTLVILAARCPGEKHKCEGSDLNARTPTRQGPQPCAFDLAWQPSLGYEEEHALRMNGDG